MDLKKNLQTYMMLFPGSFIGFLENVSEILKTLGDEWFSVGKKDWAAVFTKSSESIKEISKDLGKIRDEFDSEENEPVTAAKLIEDFNKSLMKELNNNG